MTHNPAARYGLLLLLPLLSCSPPCYSAFPPYTSYPISETSRSTLGYAVDDPKNELDPSRLDYVVSTVAHCVEQFKTAPLTADEQAQGQCYGTPTYEIRSCLTVKVAPDWRVSPCTGEQIFPCKVPDQSCLNKGMVPTAACPCSCRAMIQGDAIIVTPNLKLLPGQLTQLMTGCAYVWAGRLEQCATPL